MANIGETIGGGTLFYSGATFGLVASDIDTPFFWGGKDTEVIGTNTAIGTGQANTTTILGGFSGSSAARFCDELTAGGFTDWYLPSKDELNELYTQKAYVSGLDIHDNYWSSSQFSPRCAWIQFFISGAQSGLGGKNQTYRVRPIRTF